MPIRLICQCKRFLLLPDKYAGQRVECPDCSAMLRIPTEKEDSELTRWNCDCGQRLKARLRSSGRTVTCPRCKQPTTVPFPPAIETFVEEKFALDEESGIVHLEPPGNLETSDMAERRKQFAHKAGEPVEVDSESDITQADPPPARPVRDVPKPKRFDPESADTILDDAGPQDVYFDEDGNGPHSTGGNSRRH